MAGQNPFAAMIAKTIGGVFAFLNLDQNGNVKTVRSGKYVTCAASTTQALGAAGAVGDVLGKLIIIPGTAAAGIVQIKDGGGAAITVFAGGGTTALTSLTPIVVDLGAISTAGGWSVITNANVTAVAVGQFA